MGFLWLQSARWLGFPGGTDNCNFDIPCGSGGRLKMFASGRFRRSYATVPRLLCIGTHNTRMGSLEAYAASLLSDT